MKHISRITSLLLLLALVFALSSCRSFLPSSLLPPDPPAPDVASFGISLPLSVYHNSKWVSEDGKLTFWFNQRAPKWFGYLNCGEETIPVYFTEDHDVFTVHRVEYFDGKNFTFDWNRTMEQKDTSLDLKWYVVAPYSNYDNRIHIRFTDPKKAEKYGLPEELTMVARSVDLYSSFMEQNYPPIKRPPNYEVYSKQKDLFESPPAYDDVLEQYGLFEKYQYVEEPFVGNLLYCYYPLDKNGDGTPDLYIRLTFTPRGKPEKTYLILPEAVPKKALPLEKGAPPPKLPKG